MTAVMPGTRAWRIVASGDCTEAKLTAACVEFMETRGSESVHGPVTVRVVHYEPSRGTRTRRWPRGLPSTTTVWSRARGALLATGVVESDRDIAEHSVRKAWGPTHQVTVDVTAG